MCFDQRHVDSRRSATGSRSIRRRTSRLPCPIEAGELLQVFQWLAAGDVESVVSAGTTWQAAREMADVLINLVRLADVLGVDLGGGGARQAAGRRPALSR